ncbi:hypothetical protein PFISCL1PPCAC_2275, partial [Pristionchus fissidentatus]
QILLLFSFLLVSIESKNLVEHWECGSDTMIGSKTAAQLIVMSCTSVKREANRCCIVHDYCYDNHVRNKWTQEYCDNRFCQCLQDALDKVKDVSCKTTLQGFCASVKSGGAKAFEIASPVYPEDKFAHFVDYQPLGLEMQRLVDKCPLARGLVVDCHNSVVLCLQRDHERIKREELEEGVVEHSYQDCRATMFECLQIIADSRDNDQCTSIARDMSKSINIFSHHLNEKSHKSISEVYPIIVGRLFEQCGRSTKALSSCASSFHECALKNQLQETESYNYVRRIKIGCHKSLSDCIDQATIYETSEGCVEARNLAVNRIREFDFVKDKGFLGVLMEYVGGWKKK